MRRDPSFSTISLTSSCPYFDDSSHHQCLHPDISSQAIQQALVSHAGWFLLLVRNHQAAGTKWKSSSEWSFLLYIYPSKYVIWGGMRRKGFFLIHLELLISFYIYLWEYFFILITILYAFEKCVAGADIMLEITTQYFCWIEDAWDNN